MEAAMTKHLMLAWMIMVLAGYAAAEAGEPPREPVLRIEPGMHTAMINRIGVDAANRFLVTGSDDKTVRVWDLENGACVRTLERLLADA